MTAQKIPTGLDFEALRDAIERREPHLLLGFYADDAEAIIVNAGDPRSSPFELAGKAEIAKYLRAVFSQEASHRIEGELIGEERIEYREACEYPDGTRVFVETTLELVGGVISRQVDLVSHEEKRGDLNGRGIGRGVRRTAKRGRRATH